MKFPKRTIRDVPLDNKTVLVRTDYNVPLEANGTIADDFRILASLPTIQALVKRGCKVVIMSHLGRPEGKEEKYSLAPIAERLAELLSQKVIFVEDCIGDKVASAVKKAPKHAVILLENLRFYSEEEANDETFAGKIAKATGARYFVQDGFGVVHRAHASTAAITLKLPSVAGLLLEKEYTAIESVMKHPKHPLVAVLGGAKVSDKIPIIEALEPIAETILVGGAMANTFLAAAGVDMKQSKIESEQTEEIKKIYTLATKKVGVDNVHQFIQLPSDVMVSKSPDATHEVKNALVRDIPNGMSAFDIGEATTERYVKAIEGASTVIWNGTLGYAEVDVFAHGSARMALALATHPNVVSLIGGGDTADFVRHWDARGGDSFSHVSTGGGASLELMAGDILPGIESLLDA